MSGWSEADAVAALGAAARFGINPSLGTITRLTAALGDPHHAFRVIQVAGTNGKGSTVRMTDALLRAHGRRSAAFVSPHLHVLREHALVAGEPVSGELFAAGVGAAVEAARAIADELSEPPTQFELLTAAVLWMFREAGVEWAVLEVGMGGRWDSTSVAEPCVSVVTSVGLDHVEHLGGTLERIAWDKAHVIRAGGVGVLGPGTAAVDGVFSARGAEVGARLVRVREDARPGSVEAAFSIARPMSSPDGYTVLSYDGPAGALTDIAVPGPGYQAANAACALTACALALGGPLDAAATVRTLRQLRIAGRFEVLARRPWVIADVAHNAGGARVLVDALRASLPGRRLTVVLGVLSDKDAGAMVRELEAAASRFVVTRPASPRALDTGRLAEIVTGVTGGVPVVAADVDGALALARATGDDVLVAGSVVTVAEARVACGLHRPGEG